MNLESGNDWRISKIATLRHVTGYEKFTSE